MPTPFPTFIAAGPWQDAEFAIVRAEIDADPTWETVPTLRAVVDRIATSEPPELVLLAQSHPGADDQTDVERLRKLAPLTRVIVIAGSWCEGELRTGRPLTGVVRLYWYEFAAWWQAALRRLDDGETPPWTEPLTNLRAGEAIRLEATSGGESLVYRADAPVIAVDTTDYAAFEALSGGMNGLGWSCVWQPRHRPTLRDESDASHLAPTAGIWDGGQLDAEEHENLAAFCRRLKAHNAPVVTLLDFPRVEHVEQSHSAGAAALLAKPYQLAALHNELTRLTTLVAAD